MDVVIVDDNPVNLTVMEHLVSRVDGAVPRSFRGAEQGLAYCQSHDPDLVILDYQMPDIDGLQFIERIRALPGRDELPLLMAFSPSLPCYPPNNPRSLSTDQTRYCRDSMPACQLDQH